MKLGLVLIPIIVCSVACALQEPQCSSMFDYEHKLLYKLIKIEEEVKSFRQYVDDLKGKEIKREIEQRQEFEDVLTKFEEEAKKTFANIRAQAADLLDEQEYVAKEQSKDSSLLFKDHEEAIRNLTVVTEKLNNVKSIGFSVKAPISTATFGQISFGTVISNEGAVFDVDAGEFVCQTPGYYFFSLSILKDYSYTSFARCSIYKNGVSQVSALTQPNNQGTTGYFAATNSLFLHLNNEDKVTLGECSAIGSFHRWSSFTGFLIKADTN